MLSQIGTSGSFGDKVPEGLDSLIDFLITNGPPLLALLQLVSALPQIPKLNFFCVKTCSRL